MQPANIPVVLSGSYRRDLEGLARVYKELCSAGCEVLSPPSPVVVSENDGFALMRGNDEHDPVAIIRSHLNAIIQAKFVWLHAPEGYVGASGAFEVGLASAAGIPVFSNKQPKELSPSIVVRVVASPAEAVAQLATMSPPKSLPAFQEYIRRMVRERGFDHESVRDTMLLMTEEVGELARAIRKCEGMDRHQSNDANVAHELADVMIYLTCIANLLKIDLASAIEEKERINQERFLRR